MPDRLTPCDSITMIKDSFLELLQGKSFHEITVKEIVKKAKVGRSTFYLHYKDKRMLLNEIEKDLTAGFLEIIDEEIQEYKKADSGSGAKPECTLFTRKYFTYMRLNYDIFSILFRFNSETDYQTRFKGEVTEFCKADVIDLLGRRWDEGAGWYRTKLLIEMCMDAYIIWVESGMQIPEDELKDLLVLIRNQYMK